MRAYSLNYAKENLERIFREMLDDDEDTYITLDSGACVVAMPLERFEAWKEKNRLFSQNAVWGGRISQNPDPQAPSIDNAD